MFWALQMMHLQVQIFLQSTAAHLKIGFFKSKRDFIVVSIGAFLTVYVVFAPLEYIPTIPSLLSYVINVCKEKDNRYLKSDGRELICILTKI